MSTLGYILVFSVIGSLVSLTGGILLLFSSRRALRISHFLAAFAAGALLGTTFFDLLPEALEAAAHEAVLLWTLAGMMIFFVLERYLHWFHHHELHHHQHTEAQATAPLVILGDTVHNFIDGVVIASTFLVDIRLGMVTALAVAAHEIPQEIGDFGVLLHAGMSRAKIIGYNILSAGATVAAGLLTYWVGQGLGDLLPIFLAVTAGFFIYIAASDIIPGIHNENRRVPAILETLLLFGGIGVIWLTVSLLGA